MSKYTEDEYLDYFETHVESDGDLELDRNADMPTSHVSLSDDDGAYILCWKWVYDADLAANT